MQQRRSRERKKGKTMSTVTAQPPPVGFSVVDGAAEADALLRVMEKSFDGASLTLLSVRPEGPEYRLLSLLFAANETVAHFAFQAARLRGHSQTPRGVVLSAGGVPSLPCTQAHSSYPLLRFICGDERWDVLR